jgi:hypothetical protein
MSFLDPEQLSFVEWFTIIFVCVLGVFALCQAVDLTYVCNLNQ